MMPRQPKLQGAEHCGQFFSEKPYCSNVSHFAVQQYVGYSTNLNKTCQYFL
ncbi:Uncharacterised protein [Actinobacillus seminis]|uniref:Uncharacterized protein n=1 Tax=Actinobacillus seminis TaxID=722 RepID=A0A380VH93_9PAST|nr:hypothetical protein [Actinobacillus seminis]SUU38884.1 Uncharacterised protein [Actinobacillus seminis]